MPGVERRMLDRIGGEVARATSIVKYAPKSTFSPHTHDGGEEFFVLEGVFQDEHGDYPAGSYIRNPPTSRHAPRSEGGCTIFVKLWQMDLNDRTEVKINTLERASSFLPLPSHPGIKSLLLHTDTRETVSIESWDPNTTVAEEKFEEGGAEYFVLSGSLFESGEELVVGSWLRVPIGGAIREAKAGKEGVRVWKKTRHLRFVEAPKKK